MLKTRVIRWIARIWTLLSVGFVLLMFVGESLSEPPDLSEIPWAEFAFFPLGVCAGLVVAVWRERLGGWISIGSLAVFYVILTVTRGRPPMGPWFALVAAPGALYLWCAHRDRRELGSVAHQ